MVVRAASLTKTASAFTTALGTFLIAANSATPRWTRSWLSRRGVSLAAAMGSAWRMEDASATESWSLTARSVCQIAARTRNPSRDVASAQTELY